MFKKMGVNGVLLKPITGDLLCEEIGKIQTKKIEIQSKNNQTVIHYIEERLMIVTRYQTSFLKSCQYLFDIHGVIIIKMTATIFLLLLPLFIASLNIDMTNPSNRAFLITSIKSNEFYYSNVVNVTLYILVSIDIVANLFCNPIDLEDLIYTVTTFNSLIYYLIVMFIAVPFQMISLLWVLTNVNHYLVSTISILFLMKNGDVVWKQGIASTLIFWLGSIYSLSREYSGCMNSLKSHYGKIEYITSIILFLSMLRNSMVSLSNHNHSNGHQTKCICVYFGFLISLGVLIEYIILPLVFDFELPFILMSPSHLIVYNSFVSIIGITLTVMNKRIISFDIYKMKKYLVTKKQLFLNHISNDIRYPIIVMTREANRIEDGFIHTLIIIVDYLIRKCNELSEKNNVLLFLLEEIRSELNEMQIVISECKNVCIIISDKITDLLNYEMIGSNDLRVEMSFESVQTFMKQVVKMEESIYNLNNISLVFDQVFMDQSNELIMYIDKEKTIYALNRILNMFDKDSIISIKVNLTTGNLDMSMTINPNINVLSTSNLIIQIHIKGTNSIVDKERILATNLLLSSNDEKSIDYDSLNFNLRIYTCEGMINIQGGHLTVAESSDECIIELPLYYGVEVDRIKAGAMISSTSSLVLYYHRNPLKILICSDVITDGNCILQMLLSESICSQEPDQVGNCAEVIRLIETSIRDRYQYDLILIDHDTKGSDIISATRASGYTGVVINSKLSFY